MSSTPNTLEEDARPSKKPRLSSKGLDSVSSDNIKRSETFWLDDGNIILQAPDGTQFRVHKGTLAMSSTFFRDMFATVTDAQEKLTDGCPVVGTQDDKEDWETVLGLFYTPTSVSPDRRDLSYKKLLSMLRLGRKYQFDDVLTRAVDRLKYEFPTGLDEFDELHDYHMDMLNPRSLCHCGRIACKNMALVEIINYAVEWGIRQVLPVAYYLACAQLSFDEILEGVAGPNNSKITLCSSVRKTILRGRESIKTDIFNVWYPWLSKMRTGDDDAIIPCSSCKDTSYCEDTRHDYFDAKFLEFAALPSGLLYVYALNKLPLDYIISEEAADMDDSRHFFCAACLITLQKHYNRCRELMFGNLPKYFGMGTWEQVMPSEDNT